MELLAPGERRDVAVFVKRLSVVLRGVAGMKLFAERSTSVRVGTTLEKELRKACVERLFRVLPAAREIHPEIGLRDDRPEKCRMPAEAFRVDRRSCVWVHPAFEQPLGDLELV